MAEFGEAKLAWFRKFFPFEKGIPSHDTFTEVFARLDTIEFYAALESWAHEMARSLQGETVAFDGKTLCGSFDDLRFRLQAAASRRRRARRDADPQLSQPAPRTAH